MYSYQLNPSGRTFESVKVPADVLIIGPVILLRVRRQALRNGTMVGIR